MQLFEHGPALPFGLIAERLRAQGIVLHNDRGPWLFERHIGDTLLVLHWRAMGPAEMVPRTMQLHIANRLALSDEQTWTVFGWVRLDDERQS